MYTWLIFVSYLTDFIYFAQREIVESFWTQSEQVKNRPFERGCRWFQLFFIDFQLNYFITRIIVYMKTFILNPPIGELKIHVLCDNKKPQNLLLRFCRPQELPLSYMDL